MCQADCPILRQPDAVIVGAAMAQRLVHPLKTSRLESFTRDDADNSAHINIQYEEELTASMPACGQRQSLIREEKREQLLGQKLVAVPT